MSGSLTATRARTRCERPGGVHCYRANKDIAVVQEKLGHQHPSVTLRYIGMTQDNVRAVSEELDAQLMGVNGN